MNRASDKEWEEMCSFYRRRQPMKRGDMLLCAVLILSSWAIVGFAVFGMAQAFAELSQWWPK
jgi:hypothetical protein